MRVALAQLSASPDRKANLAQAVAAMHAAHEARADLIVFPEVILDRFFPQQPGDRTALSLAEPIPGPSSGAVAAKARELGLVTVFNLYELGDGGRRFDSSPVFADLDLAACQTSTARRLFWRDRRPELYRGWL